jgi:arsenic resistance protein ArsH
MPSTNSTARLSPPPKTHPARILMPYGCLRPRSFSWLWREKVKHILTRQGAEVRYFNPTGLPLVGDCVDATGLDAAA